MISIGGGNSRHNFTQRCTLKVRWRDWFVSFRFFGQNDAFLSKLSDHFFVYELLVLCRFSSSLFFLPWSINVIVNQVNSKEIFIGNFHRTFHWLDSTTPKPSGWNFDTNYIVEELPDNNLNYNNNTNYNYNDKYDNYNENDKYDNSPSNRLVRIFPLQILRVEYCFCSRLATITGWIWKHQSLLSWFVEKWKI